MAMQEIGVRLSVQGAAASQAELARTRQSLYDMGKAGEASAGQIKNAMRSLPAQFTDIATQLQGGQNPLTILLQQGGQIRDQFGSIGAALRGIGSFITPATLGVGAVAALGFALYESAKHARDFSNAVALSGNAAGVTADSFDAMAREVSRSSTITVSSAKEIELALVQSGTVGPRALQSMTTAIARVADLSGQSADEVTKDFIGMGKGVADWAAEHNKAWNFITAQQYAYIRGLELQGEAEKAMIVVSDQLAGRLKTQAENLGYVGQAANLAASAWGRLKEAVLSFGREATVGEKLAAAQKQLAAIDRWIAQTQSVRGLKPGGLDAAQRRRDQLQQEIAYLGETVRLENRSAEAQARSAATERVRIDQMRAAEKKGGAQSELRDYSKGQFIGPPTLEEMFPEVLKAVDPFGDFIRSERGATDEVNKALRTANAERLKQQDDLLEKLTAANDKANLELITDDRERALAQVELDRKTMQQRIDTLYGGSAQGAAAQEAADRLAAAQTQVALMRPSDREKITRTMSDSISEGILDGFRHGLSFADVFLNELKAQFAKTVLSPIIQPTVQAGNDLLGGLLKSFVGMFTSSAPTTGDFARMDRLSGSFAAGGYAAPGGTYLVGEQGPELLAMGSSGGLDRKSTRLNSSHHSIS